MWAENDRDPSGRAMGMGEEDWRGIACRLAKEELITLPCAPPSMRILAVWPLTLQTNVRRVVRACSTVKVDTPIPLFFNRRILLLVIGRGEDTDSRGRAPSGADKKSGTDSDTGTADVTAAEFSVAGKEDVGARGGGTGGSRSTVFVSPTPS